MLCCRLVNGVDYDHDQQCWRDAMQCDVMRCATCNMSGGKRKGKILSARVYGIKLSIKLKFIANESFGFISATTHHSLTSSFVCIFCVKWCIHGCELSLKIIKVFSTIFRVIFIYFCFTVFVLFVCNFLNFAISSAFSSVMIHGCSHHKSDSQAWVH